MKKVSLTCVVFLIIAVIFPLRSADAKSHWLMGGLIGAGVGVGAGLGTAAAICSIPEGSCRPKAGAYVGFPLAIGAAGFGIGALIGSAFKKNDTSSSFSETKSEYFGLIEPSLVIDPKSGFYGASAAVNF